MPPQESRRKSLKSAYLKTGLFGLVCLAAVLLMASCNMRQSGQLPDKFWAGVRPASGDTERLMKNFRYLKAAGRTELALRELEEAYHHDPDNLKIIDILAQCYEELGDWKRAEKLYQEALARDRDNPALANNLCFSYYQAGRFDKAEACFRDLLKSQPQNATVRNNLGLLLVKTGRQEEAFRLWREHENEATAKTRLNQALAALDLTPQVEVARSGDAGAPQKESAAAPPAQAAGQPQSLASAPGTLASPAAAAPQAVKQSANPEPATHLASASVQAPSETPAAVSNAPQPVPAPEKPAAIPAASSKTQPAAAVAAVKPAAAKPVSPAKVGPAAAPAAPSPENTQGKAENQKVARSTGRAANPEPKRVTILTVEELLNTRLDIRNGNGLQGIAALNRTWLTMEGFHVAAIGNHIDFGQKKTEICYHPQAERVAQVLREDFFPEAELKSSDKLGKDADVRITLGHDQKSRKGKIEERIALLDLRAQLAFMMASSGKAEKAPAVAATTKKAEVGAAPAAAEPQPGKASVSVSQPTGARPVVLTAEELTKTKIELRNGNGVQDQARKLRAEMEGEGFNVVRIKNHIDFGMAQTKILHRGRAQRVAQTLNQKYFRAVQVEEVADLPDNVDVKIILGKDLSGGLDLMAKAD
jgi:Flp pilus assembly protein TadD/uncharacterized protein (DUF736 family)